MTTKVLVPAGLSNVTLTANNLGDATIQGPGDLAGVNLERRSWCLIVLFPGLGPGLDDLEASRFSTLDLSIGMFAGATTDYKTATIQNNPIRDCHRFECHGRAS